MKYSLILPESPVGALEVVSDGEFITELNFMRDKLSNAEYSYDLNKAGRDKTIYILNLPSRVENVKKSEAQYLNVPHALSEAFLWLSDYFLCRIPGNKLALKPRGTDFQKEVFEELLKIPYGKTASYGEIAKKIAEKRNGRMSARAVGQAAGKNPIPVFIPCHRLIGSDGGLTGFSGGMDIKIKLLQLEKQGMGA